METTKTPKGIQMRAMARPVLADITPVNESGAMDTFPDTTSASESVPKEPPQSWDSLCVAKSCPIKHPHNFGLRPKTPLFVWQHPDAAVANDGAYLDTQPPPLIKAMIDTLRNDPEIKTRYPRFTDVLRDFYRAHGGGSDKYHGADGMFGLGVDLSGENVYGFFPYHKHPDEERVGGWFAFEIMENKENEEPVATGCY